MREHIIADLSVNYTERLVLRQGHTVQRVHFDYGYDLFVQTFDTAGQVEPGYILLQLKASDSPRWVEHGEQWAITLERRDLDAWLNETSPVFLVCYDAAADFAYWLAVQEDGIRDAVNATSSTTVTVRVPKSNALTEDTIERFRQAKGQNSQRNYERWNDD